MWHSLSNLRFHGKRISHHFFPSYHGHSLADAHAAIIKRMLHSRYVETELERMAYLEEATRGPTNIQDMASLIRARCADTQVHVFDQIEREDDHKPPIDSLQAIKSKHCFTYQNNECYALVKSGEEETRTEFQFRNKHSMKLKFSRTADGWDVYK